MIKIVLTWGIAIWEKDNKRYICIRKYNGEETIYNKKIYILCVTDATNRSNCSKIENSITSESLADINKRLEKTEVEIVED